MSRLEKRVADLETAAGVGDTSRPKTWHRITAREGETEEEAIDAYGREKIGEHDGLVIRRIVTPKRDANGGVIPPPSARRS